MANYDPFNEQIIGLRQQQALAQKLREQANQPSQGQMVSGWYVPSSPFDALASGLMNYKASQREKAAEEGIKSIGEQRKAQNEAWRQSAPQDRTIEMEDRSALPEAQQTQMGPSPYSKALRVRPTTDETLAWAMRAPGLDTGAVAQLGVKSAELEAGRQARLGERQLVLEAEAKRERERAEDKREAQERELRARQENIRLSASLRPERMVNLLGPNGESIATPASQVTPGMAIWSPAGAKYAQEVGSKQKGREDLSSTLDTLAGYYNSLNQGMGMPSTQNKWGSNLGAWAEGTGAGNWLGRTGILGKGSEENASMRDSIAQTRPLLLADIKKATGMTASEMNSNAELQMWLSVATDPTKGYESNIRALQNLEKKFGLGRGDEKNNPFLNAAPAATGKTLSVDY